MTQLRIAEHPLLDAAAFVTTFDRPLGECPTPDFVTALLRPIDPTASSSMAPLSTNDDVRKAVRDLLRHGGYKPTGRGKPSSEYLLGAAAESGLPTINLAVDTCNAASYHSGLPISVVDLDRATEPFELATPPAGTSYVFNASGQTIDVGGLLCLFDGAGPCANAVKDAQRTKTNAETRRTLSIVWGTRALADRSAATARWYRELLERGGAGCSSVSVEGK